MHRIMSKSTLLELNPQLTLAVKMILCSLIYLNPIIVVRVTIRSLKLTLAACEVRVSRSVAQQSGFQYFSNSGIKAFEKLHYGIRLQFPHTSSIQSIIEFLGHGLPSSNTKTMEWSGRIKWRRGLARLRSSLLPLSGKQTIKRE